MATSVAIVPLLALTAPGLGDSALLEQSSLPAAGHHKHVPRAGIQRLLRTVERRQVHNVEARMVKEKLEFQGEEIPHRVGLLHFRDDVIAGDEKLMNVDVTEMPYGIECAGRESDKPSLAVGSHPHPLAWPNGEHGCAIPHVKDEDAPWLQMALDICERLGNVAVRRLVSQYGEHEYAGVEAAVEPHVSEIAEYELHVGLARL